eukprot:6050486-Prymnesium_polylepis.1
MKSSRYSHSVHPTAGWCTVSGRDVSHTYKKVCARGGPCTVDTHRSLTGHRTAGAAARPRERGAVPRE